MRVHLSKKAGHVDGFAEHFGDASTCGADHGFLGGVTRKEHDARAGADRRVRRNRLSRIVRIPVWPCLFEQQHFGHRRNRRSDGLPQGARPRDLEALTLEGVGEKGTAAFVAVCDDDVRHGLPQRASAR